jgi:hypothetical protein
MNIYIEPFSPDKETLKFLKDVFGITRKQVERDHYAKMVAQAYRTPSADGIINLICHDKRAAKICREMANSPVKAYRLVPRANN